MMLVKINSWEGFIISLIMLDSVIKASKKYYLQRLLEECKYGRKSLIVYVNHALLDFYLCQSRWYKCYRFNSDD